MNVLRKNYFKCMYKSVWAKQRQIETMKQSEYTWAETAELLKPQITGVDSGMNQKAYYGDMTENHGGPLYN